MTDVAVATEDELSEAVCRKLLGEVGLNPFLELRKGGNGYLRSRVEAFCRMAQSYPVVVLTDQDRIPCAPSLVRDWLRNQIVPPNLLLRVAVREVEAWLLADAEGVREFFGVTVATHGIEEAPDPKQLLLETMRASMRAVRNSLVEIRRGHAYCGVGYNNELLSYVNNAWSPGRAACVSESLARMRLRLSELAQRVQGRQD